MGFREFIRMATRRWREIEGEKGRERNGFMAFVCDMNINITGLVVATQWDWDLGIRG